MSQAIGFSVLLDDLAADPPTARTPADRVFLSSRPKSDSVISIVLTEAALQAADLTTGGKVSGSHVITDHK